MLIHFVYLTLLYFACIDIESALISLREQVINGRKTITEILNGKEILLQGPLLWCFKDNLAVFWYITNAFIVRGITLEIPKER